MPTSPQQASNTTNSRSSYRPNWVRIPKIPKQTYSNRNAARKAWNRANPSNRIKSPPSSPSPPPPANPGNGSPTGGGVGQVVRWAMKGGVGTLARAIPGALALILLDPFSPQETEEDAMLKKLMPPESPKEIEKGKYQFTGGQGDKIKYKVIVRIDYKGYSEGFSIRDFNVWGAFGGLVIVSTVHPTQGFPVKKVYSKSHGGVSSSPRAGQFEGYLPDMITNHLEDFGDPYGLGIHEITISSVTRLDGQPDTSGNPPPIIQPIYTTNITNNYTIIPPPIVGKSNSPAPTIPPIIISPINASAAPPVASAPPPQIVIPQIKPDTPLLISPIPSDNQQTSPDTATSPPPPSYPSVTKSPSTGITAQQAEESKYKNTQVTPSSGVTAEPQITVKPEVAPVPESATEPTVKDSDRTLTFTPSISQSAANQSQSQAQSQTAQSKLLEIEQALTRLRISITSLQPSESVTTLSRDLESIEQSTASLRERAPTISSETYSTELQRIRNRLRGTQARIIRLNPSAQSHLADLQRQQIEQQIDREVSRLRSPTTPDGQTETQTPSPSQTNTETQTTLERLQEQLTNVGLGIALLTPLVNPIQNTANNTTPDALRNAAASGVCSTLKPGGCMSGVANNAATAANNSTTNQGLLNRILSILQGANQTLLPFILQRVQTIDNKLGAQIPGGIGSFMQTAFRATRIDKIVNALTLLAVLHNAALLSRSLAITLGELTSQVLSVIGIKDEEGSPLDINKELGRQVDNLFKTVLGEEVWAGTKTAWNKANTIISTTSQIMSTVRGLWDSSKEVLEWTAENTGKIGNALKKFRVVGENAYRWMPERVTHQNAWALKIERFRNKTDSLDDAASSLQGVLGEVQSIQSEFKELNEQKEKFDKSIADITPKDRADNKPVADAVKASRDASKAPSDAADVFRGAGEG